MAVPKLRFKEFTDEWSLNKLSEITMIFDGTHQTPKYTKCGVKFVSVENIHDLLGSNKYISERDYFKEYSNKEAEKNNILMTRIGDIGTSAVITSDEKIAYYVSLALFKCNRIVPKFLHQAISSPPLQHEFWRRTLHIAFPKKINKGEIEESKISFPKEAEQKKIADFLSLLDRKIALQEKKIALLKDYKKGVFKLLQNKFNYQSTEFQIKDLFDITRGVVIAKTDISEKKTSSHSYPVYSSQTFNDGILGYDDTYDFKGDYLTWTTDGANAGSVFRRNGEFRCTNVCGLLIGKEIGIVNDFIVEILNDITPRYVSYVGNPKLMNGVMAEVKIILPSLDTQNQISNLLKALSIKIKSNQNVLDKVKHLKQALLQQMFI